jgi:DnaD/phage-associated family protein
MGHYTWIKLYNEILDDPKMGRLPDYLWRRAVELFLLAGKTGTTGYLPPVEEMAWALRLEVPKLTQNLHSLAEIGVVHEAEPGKWVVTHFAKRQAAMSDAERKAAQRAGVTKPVTKRDTGGHETVTEVEVEEDSTTTTSAKNLFVLYSENFGALTSFIAEELKDLEKTYSEEWVKAAMSEAVSNEKRNVKYVAAILRRWMVEGFQSKKQIPEKLQPSPKKKQPESAPLSPMPPENTNYAPMPPEVRERLGGFMKKQREVTHANVHPPPS